MSNEAPTLQQLERGLELSRKIAEMQVELASLFGGSGAKTKSSLPNTDGRRAKRSPETIAKMRVAQQARWAKVKGTKGKSSAPSQKTGSVRKKKRTISPETKAKLAAAMKARWAAKKAGKSPAPTAKK